MGRHDAKGALSFFCVFGDMDYGLAVNLGRMDLRMASAFGMSDEHGPCDSAGKDASAVSEVLDQPGPIPACRGFTRLYGFRLDGMNEAEA